VGRPYDPFLLQGEYEVLAFAVHKGSPPEQPYESSTKPPLDGLEGWSHIDGDQAVETITDLW